MNLIAKTHILILAATLLSTPCFSQTTAPAALPQNFAAAGAGFQSTSSPQTSGWISACHRNPDITLFGLTVPSYLCASTDYTGSDTSARVDVDTVVWQRAWFTTGTKTGGGAALNAAGVGGSYALGGWAAADVSPFLKITGARIVASITWQKDDVAAAQTANGTSVLRQLASRGT